LYTIQTITSDQKLKISFEDERKTINIHNGSSIQIIKQKKRLTQNILDILISVHDKGDHYFLGSIDLSTQKFLESSEILFRNPSKANIIDFYITETTSLVIINNDFLVTIYKFPNDATTNTLEQFN